MTSRQEQAWAGAFGDKYHARQKSEGLAIQRSTVLMVQALRNTREVRSVLEFGAGKGHNLRALKFLIPSATLHAVEINHAAAEACKWCTTTSRCSIFNFPLPTNEVPDPPYDMVLTKGLLIHIPPERHKEAHAKIYTASRRYILLCEYYAPHATMVPYRGEIDMLWRADHAGAMLDTYPDLSLIDYGFQYHRDPNWPQDDLTWFLMEKKQ